MTARQIEANADVVAQGLASAWRNAYVIACSVRSGSGPADAEKVPATEFARMVKAHAGGKVYGLGESGIRASLRKWDRVAKETGLPTSDQLTPADAVNEVPYPDRPWYEEKGSANVERSKVGDIKGNPAAVARAVGEDPRLLKSVMEALGANPELAWQAAELLAKLQPDTVVAIADVEREKVEGAHAKGAERARKEHEAHDADAKLIVGPQLFNGAFMALHAAILDMQEAGVRDADSIAYAQTLAAALRESAALVEAWALSAGDPIPDADFESGIQAILDGAL
jgi:hypothetical protein